MTDLNDTVTTAQALDFLTAEAAKEVERTYENGDDLTLGDFVADLHRRLDHLLKADRPSTKACDHRWVLTEDGYTRTWHTEIDPDGYITATSNGFGDYSEEGDGAFLQCSRCQDKGDVDDPEKISYQ